MDSCGDSDPCRSAVVTSDDPCWWPVGPVVQRSPPESLVQCNQVGDVARTVVFEEAREFSVDAGRFDPGFDVVDVSFADDVPDVFSLHGGAFALREVRVGDGVIVVPRAFVVDSGGVLRFPVWQDVLVVPEFRSVFVGSGKRHVDVAFEQGFGPVSHRCIGCGVESRCPGA